MEQDKQDWLEVVKLVNEYKDVIKKSSTNIFLALNNPLKFNVDAEKIEILNALGKIGTLSNNAQNVNSYAGAWADAFHIAMLSDPSLRIHLIRHLLDQICSTAFHVEKKGSKFQINIPINFNALKF